MLAREPYPSRSEPSRTGAITRTALRVGGPFITGGGLYVAVMNVDGAYGDRPEVCRTEQVYSAAARLAECAPHGNTLRTLMIAGGLGAAVLGLELRQRGKE